MCSGRALLSFERLGVRSFAAECAGCLGFVAPKFHKHGNGALFLILSFPDLVQEASGWIRTTRKCFLFVKVPQKGLEYRGTPKASTNYDINPSEPTFVEPLFKACKALNMDHVSEGPGRGKRVKFPEHAAHEVRCWNDPARRAFMKRGALKYVRHLHKETIDFFRDLVGIILRDHHASKQSSPFIPSYATIRHRYDPTLIPEIQQGTV